MAEESEEQGDTSKSKDSSRDEADTAEESDDAGDSEVEDADDDEVEDEPKLKYARLTSHLLSVYRNGDATSAFMVTGDKMVRLCQRNGSWLC